MTMSVKILFLGVIFVISACDKDKSLSPAKDTKHITIKIHSTSDVDILPVDIMYRSELCSFTRHDSRGKEYKVDGYNSMLLPATKNNGFSIASVPVDGGGACNWKLSNATIKFKYDQSKFDKSVDESLADSVILIFDDHFPQKYNGNIKEILSDNVTINRVCFPWINTNYLGNHGKTVYLSPFSDRHLFSYKVKVANTITVWLDSNYDNVVYSEGPKVKKEIDNTFVIFKYSDGTIDAKGIDFPDLKKLQTISKAK